MEERGRVANGKGEARFHSGWLHSRGERSCGRKFRGAGSVAGARLAECIFRRTVRKANPGAMELKNGAKRSGTTAGRRRGDDSRVVKVTFPLLIGRT